MLTVAQTDFMTNVAPGAPIHEMLMESMGSVYPRQYEHLLNSDLGVARMRRTLVDNAERVLRGERWQDYFHPAPRRVESAQPAE